MAMPGTVCASTTPSAPALTTARVTSTTLCTTGASLASTGIPRGTSRRTTLTTLDAW